MNVVLPRQLDLDFHRTTVFFDLWPITSFFIAELDVLAVVLFFLVAR